MAPSRGKRSRARWGPRKVSLRSAVQVLLIFVALWILWMPSSLDLPMDLAVLAPPPSTANAPPSNSSVLSPWTSQVVDSTTNRTIYHHSNFHVSFPLCLVHIGKAAGSSVSCGLGLMYADCEGMPRDALDHVHFFHMRRNQCPAATTSTYLVTLRNPVTRLQSWFDFEKTILPSRNRDAKTQEQMQRQRGRLFQECFSTFEELVVQGLQPLTRPNVTVQKVQNMTCSERAWAATLGVRAFSYHEWYNYEYYWTGMHDMKPRNDGLVATTGTAVDDRQIYALRTEHLQRDWETVSTEPLFRPVNQGPRESNSTTHQRPTKEPQFLDAMNAPSDSFRRGLKQLCTALCPEIQVYKQFLSAAVNLNDEQRNESLAEVQVYCPEEGREIRDCPSLPSFAPMKVPGRQYRTEVKKRLFEKLPGKRQGGK